MGKSPFSAMHCTAATSSVFNGSSPNVNGNNCGRTLNKNKMKRECFIHPFVLAAAHSRCKSVSKISVARMKIVNNKKKKKINDSGRGQNFKLK